MSARWTRRQALRGLVSGAVVLLASGCSDDAPRGPRPRPVDPGGAPVVDVRDHGAVGDGSVDDGPALQAALQAVAVGGRVVLPRGGVFAHADVVVVDRPGVLVTGGGTLLALDEERSSVWVDADDVRLEDLVVRTASTTRRWEAYEQAGVRVVRGRGAALRRLRVEGAAAAGVYVGGGARDWLVEDVVVTGSRADGVHVTQGARDGVVRRTTVLDPGDDGVAVVSYEQDGDPCARVVVEGCTVRGGSHGRGFSVVGGRDVLLRDLQAEGTSAAGLYLAVEGEPYLTTSTRRVRAERVRLLGCNTDAEVDHGAVLLFSGRDGRSLTDVELSDVLVEGTRPGASRSVGVLAVEGADVADVVLRGVSVRGGPPRAFQADVEDDGEVRRVDWRVDGRRLDLPA